MNSNTDYEHEIDLLDLFWEWLTHWKSFIVAILLGIGIGAAFILSAPKAVDAAKAEQLSKEEEIASAILGLSESERLPVENLVESYENCLSLKEEYNAIKDTLSLSEKVEMFDHITEAEYFIENTKKNLSDDQESYFYSLIGATTTTTTTTTTNSSSGLKKAIICIFITAFLHVGIFCVCYIFNRKVKYTEDLSSVLRCPELSKCIDWDFINSKKGIDRWIAKARLSREQMVDIQESIQINANTIARWIDSNGIQSLAILCGDLREQAETLKSAILCEHTDLSVKCIGSITYDFSDAKSSDDVSGAVMLAKVKHSNLDVLQEERKSLMNRKIELLGLIRYI